MGERLPKLKKDRAQPGDPLAARRAELTETLLLKFRQEVDDRLADLHWPRKRLAEELQVTEGRISQILAGADNVTLRTIASIVVALDADLTMDIVSCGAALGKPRSSYPRDLAEMRLDLFGEADVVWSAPPEKSAPRPAENFMPVDDFVKVPVKASR